MAEYIISNGILYKTTSNAIDFNKIKPGSYGLDYDPQSRLITLNKLVTTTDQLIDLPNSTYGQILDEVKLFFSDKTKQTFETNGFIYKKSILLYGKPGTGKTCLISKIGETFNSFKSNGLVIINPSLPGFLIFSKLLPKNTPCLVIFEEFDHEIEYNEHKLLGLLDGEDQRSNTFYLFTTNFISKIPKRLLRPGRMSNIIEMSIPTTENREFFLKTKVPTLTDKQLAYWVEHTKGMTIDELKHTILLHVCLLQPLPEVLNKVTEHAKHSENERDRDPYETIFEEEDQRINKRFMQLMLNLSKGA